MKHKLKIIIILAVIAKLILHFLVVEDFKMNSDEERNYQIALNNQHGNGYTIFDSGNKLYKQTAFHGSFQY